MLNDINLYSKEYSSEYVVIHYRKIIAQGNTATSITKHIDSTILITDRSTIDEAITSLVERINNQFGFPSITITGVPFSKSFTGELPSIASVIGTLRIYLEKENGLKEVRQYEYDCLTLPNGVPVAERDAWALALLTQS